MSRLGQRDAARERVSHSTSAIQARNSITRSTSQARVLSGTSRPGGRVPARSAVRAAIRSIRLWALYMSLGDREAARNKLARWIRSRTNRYLGEAAGLPHGRPSRGGICNSRPAPRRFPADPCARCPGREAGIDRRQSRACARDSRTRLPDLVTGIEPINARNSCPPSTSRRPGQAPVTRHGRAPSESGGGVSRRARCSPLAHVHLPARAHPRVGGRARTRAAALDRAYEAGFRTTWAIDLLTRVSPISILCEMDPAFMHSRRSALQGLARAHRSGQCPPARAAACK